MVLETQLWNSIDLFTADEKTATVKPSVQMGMHAINHCSNWIKHKGRIAPPLPYP